MVVHVCFMFASRNLVPVIESKLVLRPSSSGVIIGFVEKGSVAEKSKFVVLLKIV